MFSLRYIIATLVIVVVNATSDSDPVSFYSLPLTSDTSYSQQGDINVGALIVTYFSGTEACSPRTRLYSTTIEQTEAVAFAVEHVNRSPDILPNVTLGFVIQGVCRSLGPTLAASTLFIPTNEGRDRRAENDNVTIATTAAAANGMGQRSGSGGGTTTTTSNNDVSGLYLGHDVIGVMSPGWSSMTTPISSLYAAANVPFIAATETEDELSDKRRHPYFFRIAPPQAYQVKAILQFIQEHGWSYISVLYTDCTFSLTTLIDNIERYGICIASMHQFTSSIDYDEVVSELLANPRARAVVVFITSSHFGKMLRSVVKHNAQGHFIWIGSNLIDSYGGIETEDQMASDPAIGTIYFDTYSSPIPSYFDHLQNVDIYETKNKWLAQTWERYFNCSVDAGTCDTNDNLLLNPRYRTFKGTPLRVDAILTLAQAAHDLLADRCPDARGQEARACITRQLLREYLKNVSFDGFVSRVEFDQNHDIRGRYSIKQVVYDYPNYLYLPNTTITKKQILGREIGIYDISKQKFSYFEGKISWSHLNTVERIIPWAEDSLPVHIPESVCSRPCLPGEYKIEKKVSCCWECRTCRENERFTNGNTSCEACPSFTWPDPTSGFITCTDLPLTYSTLPDTIPLVLTSLAILALIGTVAISVTYVIFRNERIIKASSKELSFLQLVAIFLGYSTIILFQTAPSDAMCGVIFFLFCMSFAMLYCPLLAKASRIFRIFKSGAKNERPRFISPQSQVLFSTSLLAVQITLCVATYILYTPKALRIQPVWTEKLVELSCDLTLPGLASFLGYNIVLVSVCSVFAFLTRTLPDNFNESKFISMCVSTTLLIWLAFIPTYFTASREFVRVFLLSVALFLNHSVALIFLFVPKVYAVLFLPTTEGHVSNKANH